MKQLNKVKNRKECQQTGHFNSLLRCILLYQKQNPSLRDSDNDFQYKTILAMNWEITKFEKVLFLLSYISHYLYIKMFHVKH